MNNEATTRAAETLLRINGGCAVILRVPVPAIPDDVTEELGLATPAFTDIPLHPAVFRKTNNTDTLLIAARAVEAAAGAGGAEALLKTANSVVIDDVAYTITNVLAETANGKAYCYALSLRAPTW